MAITSFLRTIVATEPYSAFWVLSFSYLLVSCTILTIGKCKEKDKFAMNWYRKKQKSLSISDVSISNSVLSDRGNEWEFSKAQLAMVIFGGLGEMGCSIFSILAFSLADKFMVNAGIAGVLMPLTGLLVAIGAYFITGEKLQKVQGLGLLVVMAGATLIAIFPPKEQDDEV